ncbi:MAG: 23S rRNA (adenine(2503)-C(2))-methyltransferase RlmN [Chitinispirillaceae bacterium]
MSNPTHPALITDLTISQLREEISGAGEPAFRARQIIKWVYQKRVSSYDQMRNVAKKSREKLSAMYSVRKLTPTFVLESDAGDAVKFGFSAGNGPLIESVLLYDKKRRTACISSQLGCALGCVFCETARLGFIRNLTLHEITGQLIAINDYIAEREDASITNIVFMGMGEALSNFDTFVSAVEIIMHEDGLNLGSRRITVSTAGVIPSIRKLRDTGLNLRLAISLNTYDDALRDKIMPINRRYKIAELVQAADDYARASGNPVTFEYVVISGENDTAEAVGRLKKLLHRVSCKINLIPVNPLTDNRLHEPTEEALQSFARALRNAGLAVTVRRSRGRDISGACGQLAGNPRGRAIKDQEIRKRNHSESGAAG